MEFGLNLFMCLGSVKKGVQSKSARCCTVSFVTWQSKLCCCCCLLITARRLSLSLSLFCGMMMSYGSLTCVCMCVCCVHTHLQRNKDWMLHSPLSRCVSLPPISQSVYFISVHQSIFPFRYVLSARFFSLSSPFLFSLPPSSSHQGTNGRSFEHRNTVTFSFLSLPSFILHARAAANNYFYVPFIV